MMKHTTAVVLAAAVAFLLGNFPTEAVAHSHDRAPVSSAPAMADGEVRKIDRDAGKVTIRHGELKNLDMPAMTMVFRVKEPVMLDKLQPGDKIKFTAEKIGGQFTVTDFEPAN